MVQVEAKIGIKPEDPSALMMPAVMYKINPRVMPTNIIKIDLLFLNGLVSLESLLRLLDIFVIM